MKSAWMVVAAGSMMVAVVGCEDKKPATTPATPTKTAAGAQTDDAKEKAAAALQSGLAAAKLQMDALGEKIKSASMEAKPLLQATMDKMKTEYDALSAKVAEMKASPKWQEISTEAKAKLNSLTTSIGDALAKLK